MEYSQVKGVFLFAIGGTILVSSLEIILLPGQSLGPVEFWLPSAIVFSFIALILLGSGIVLMLSGKSRKETLPIRDYDHEREKATV